MPPIDKIEKIAENLVNTHAHGDHTGSNAEFPAEVEIVAQENTLARMQTMSIFEAEVSKVGLPDKTFKNRLTLFRGKDAVDLYYYGNAILSWQDFTRYAELTRLLLMHERAAFEAGLSPEQTFADFRPPVEFDDLDRVGSSFGGVSAVQTTFDELRRSRD